MDLMQIVLNCSFNVYFESYFFFYPELNNVRNQSVNIDDQIQQLNKQLQQEKVLKLQAVNKLAEIMNRKDWSGKHKSSASDLRKKEKECRKLQQELTVVSEKCLQKIWNVPSQILYCWHFCQQHFQQRKFCIVALNSVCY